MAEGETPGGNRGGGGSGCLYEEVERHRRPERGVRDSRIKYIQQLNGRNVGILTDMVVCSDNSRSY